MMQTHTRDESRYPQSFRHVLQESPFENILDSNMFAAYIPRELAVPHINDPRKTQNAPGGTFRHPGYVPSTHINQVFNYLGFVKRNHHSTYQQYLPMLFHELNLFSAVIEEIVYQLDVTIPEEIYIEQKKGMESFFDIYHSRAGGNIAWINDIWKHQKLFLDRMDTLFETLKARRRIFDLSSEDLYKKIMSYYKETVRRDEPDRPSERDFGFVANICTKAAIDNAPKVLWSGDKHIFELLKLIYADPGLCRQFPQVYLHSGYNPHNHARWFPAS